MKIVKVSEFKQRKPRKSVSNKRDLITYLLFLIWPITQFIVFYLAVNANSILLTFQEYAGGTKFVFAEQPFANLAKAANDFFVGEYKPYLVGTLIMFALTLFIGTPLALLFSYYIYKKMPLHNAFRVMLFLPSIISATVLAIMFKYFANYALPRIVDAIFGTGTAPLTGYFSTKPFSVVAFFNIFIGFGTSVLMYANKMSTIDESVIEAAKIDGAKPAREFFSIVLPYVYPTFVVFFVTGVGTLLVNQFNVMTFFGWDGNPDVNIFGFRLFAQAASLDYSKYPSLSALGILVSAIVIPITLILRKVLTKYGPSEN